MHVYFYFPMHLPSRLAHPRSQWHEISSLVHSYFFKLLKLSSILYFSKIFTKKIYYCTVYYSLPGIISTPANKEKRAQMSRCTYI